MRKLRIAVVASLLAVLSTPVKAIEEPRPPVSVKLPSSGYVSRYGHLSYITATIWISPNPNNKAVKIEWESDASYGSSRITLNGEDSPRVMQRTLNFVRGDYTVRVFVTDNGTEGDENIIASASTFIRDLNDTNGGRE